MSWWSSATLTDADRQERYPKRRLNSLLASDISHQILPTSEEKQVDDVIFDNALA